MARPGNGRFYKQMNIHYSFASIIDYAKKVIDKSMRDDINIETTTFVMAKNSIIDGNKILIILPKGDKLKHEIKKKPITQNIYMV